MFSSICCNANFFIDYTYSAVITIFYNNIYFSIFITKLNGIF